MANPLNLYATKVFAEQPLALWALDDKADYISFISTSDRDLDTWTSTGVTSIVDATDDNVFDVVPPALPFIDAKANGVISSIDNNGLVTFTSPFQLNPEDISSDMKTFSFGTYVYSYSKIIDLRIGYRYTNPLNSEIYEVIKAATTSTTLAWASVSESFAIPNNFENLELIIEVYYVADGSPYEFVLNGITAGQWAEEFQLTSYGVDLIDVPNTIAIQETQGVEAQIYGLSGTSGYYIVDNNKLVAKNTGMPLVYGSSNSTEITKKNNSPSLIIPGYGFMSESGKNKKFTAEFWIRIQSNAMAPRKIFGPIASDDGLYVDGPFIKLRVGGLIQSHFIREWDRPMLLNIVISSKSANLIINGDEVISINIENETYRFPNKISDNGLEQDWLGFYAYDDVPLITLDCVGMYPYEVAPIVAKRRWAYGQAVETPSAIKGSDSTSSIVIDYPFSEYSKNYSFPNSSKWSSGILENLIAEDDALLPPTHALPEVKLQNISETSWLNTLSLANQELNDPFISLRPDLFVLSAQAFDDLQGYLYFPNMNFLLEQTKAFYGIFETATDYNGKQTLFKITNDTTSNYVEIYLDKDLEIDENIIYYTFNIKKPDGTMKEEIFYQARGQRAGDKFLVGIDIPRFVRDKGKEVANFFGTRQNLKMFIGGTSNFTDTFRGKIRRVGFCNSRNLAKIQHFFTSYGIPVNYENVFDSYGMQVFDAGGGYFGSDVDAFGNAISPPPEYWSLILDGGDPYDFVTIGTEEHTATYTLVPKSLMNNFYLDIETNSYWEEYLPLSYFAKEMVDSFGNSRRQLSFLQFNIGFPRMERFDGDYYNTNGALIKSYISFQYLQSGSNAITGNFTAEELLNKDRIVRPGSGWMSTLYEVVDGAIIYPPTDVSFEKLSVNIHLEIIVDGIISNPIKIRSLELSSESYNDSPKKIGTKFGTSIVPFSKAGSYFNYRNVSPTLIYKGSSPYLYQTGNSGIQMLGTYANENKGGLSMPINKNAASFFKIGTMQMFIRYDEDNMPKVPAKIFELESASGRIDFFLISDSSTQNRGQIYAVNSSTNRLQSGIMFFIDGKPVKRPIVYPRRWSALGISFPDFLSFNDTVGSLRVTSPLMFDNISYYQTSIRDDEERFGFRQWFSVRNRLGADIDWGYWAGKEQVGDNVIDIPGEGFTWQEVLFLSAILREELDASTVYNVYTGTSRIIAESDNNFVINNYEYNIYRDLTWLRNAVVSV
jgi:hypothetical protein